MIDKRAFCDALIEIAPELRSIVDEETEDDGYILLHEVVVDVRQFMLERLKQFGPDDALLRDLLDCIESSFSDADYDVENAIAVSFVESLRHRRRNAEWSEYASQMLLIMGPKLKEVYEQQENWRQPGSTSS